MSIKRNQRTSTLIGLGGNIGDVVHTMQRALNTIHARDDCSVLAVSKVYRTPPWGVTEQAWFLNAAADVYTDLTAEALLDLLLSIEIDEGRVRDKRWGPRTLDLDIIAFGDSEIRSERLTVPHPRMGERAFVVVPLLDIAAERMVSGRPIKDYAAELDRGGIEVSNEKLIISSR